jgi:drug/metabolite transporter (DMT)-like permease
MSSTASRPNRESSHSAVGDFLLLAAINFMWALKWTTGKVALHDLDPVSITLFPMMGSMLLLFPFLSREVQGSKTYLGIFRQEALKPQNLFRFFLLGTCGQVVVQVLTTWGVKYVTATDAAFIGLAAPLLNAALAVPIAGESLTWRHGVGFVFAVCGVLLMPGIHLHAGHFLKWDYLIGALLLILASLGAAFYNAYSKRLLNQFRPMEILFYSYVFVILTLIPLQLSLHGSRSAHGIADLRWQTWLSLILLSVFVYGLSMILFLRLLARRSLVPIAVSFYEITIFGALISTTILRERVTLSMAIGAALVFCGTLVSNTGRKRENIDK